MVQSSCIASLEEKNGSGSRASSKERRGHAARVVSVIPLIPLLEFSDLLGCTETARNHQNAAVADMDPKDRELMEAKTSELEEAGARGVKPVLTHGHVREGHVGRRLCEPGLGIPNDSSS